MNARQAVAADIDELVRLRGVLLASMHPTATDALESIAADVPGSAAGPIGPDAEWQEAARQSLTNRLAEAQPSLVAFVVERPDGTGLAACVLGSIERRLGSRTNPSGRVGYVFSVATDPDMRRRGFSRACMTALLDWYRTQGVTAVDLRASPEAEPLYHSLGFTRNQDPAMRLIL